MLWKDLANDNLDPEQWGWKLDGTILVPVMTDQAPAPESLLKFVQCKCKLTSKNPCGTNHRYEVLRDWKRPMNCTTEAR